MNFPCKNYSGECLLLLSCYTSGSPRRGDFDPQLWRHFDPAKWGWMSNSVNASFTRLSPRQPRWPSTPTTLRSCKVAENVFALSFPSAADINSKLGEMKAATTDSLMSSRWDACDLRSEFEPIRSREANKMLMNDHLYWPVWKLEDSVLQKAVFFCTPN